MVTTALGLDLKASGISLGAVEDDGNGPRWVASWEWFARKPKSGQRVEPIERLYRVGEVTRRVLVSWIDEYRPGALLIENPRGRHRAPTLVAAYGTVCAAAYAAALDVGTSCVVFSEDARTWRRAAGCSSLPREDPKAGGLRLATLVGCPEDRSEDEREACAMAVRALKVAL